jgi:transposase
MAGIGRRYGGELKARVALEALRGEPTITQPVAKQGVHRTLIDAWKRQAVEGMPGACAG